MKNISDFLHRGTTVPIILTIIGILSFITIGSLAANPFSAIPQVDIRFESPTRTLTTGDMFEVTIIVESTIPVNAFEGNIEFDSSVFTVDKIDYNTSIADLWVKEPWYVNGDGTIYFAGGTTRTGGFVGTDMLMTITFSSIREGVGYIGMRNARILQHDGFGTNAVIKEPIDTLFTVTPRPTSTREVLRKQSSKNNTYIVLDEKPSTDLNNDGKQTIADLSIFMLHLASQNKRSDFNSDGIVNTTDLSIIINTK